MTIVGGTQLLTRGPFDFGSAVIGTHVSSLGAALLCRNLCSHQCSEDTSNRINLLAGSDYIVAGVGTAGCVLVARLSEDAG